MSPPPLWLVEWTNWALAFASLIAVIVALITGLMTASPLRKLLVRWEDELRSRSGGRAA